MRNKGEDREEHSEKGAEFERTADRIRQAVEEGELTREQAERKITELRREMFGRERSERNRGEREERREQDAQCAETPASNHRAHVRCDDRKASVVSQKTGAASTTL